MQTVVILCATVVALLAGCTFGPDYQRPALPVPAQHRAAESPTPGQEAVSLADMQWFALFQDERLQELVKTALENNYDARIAAARVLEAAAQLGVTRSFLLPTVDGTATVARDRVSEERFLAPPASPEGNTFALGLALTWEVDIWGRIRRQTEAARAELLSAEWAQRAVLVTVISQVASAYFALRAFDSELEIAQRTLASRQQSVRLTQLRLEQGVATRLDVRQAETLLYTAAAAIPEAERQRVQTENVIRLLLAQPPGDILRGRTLTEQPTPPEIPAGLPAALLDQRPDIRASEEILVAANAQIGAAKALYFPRISITGLLGIESAELADFVKASALTWSIGADALQPIFNYGRIRSINAATQARHLQFLAQYEQTIQTAFREVSDALIGYYKTREQRAQQTLLVGALQDRVALANLRFFGGLDSYLQVLDAERDLFDAELTLVRLQRDELLNIVGLYRALGGGWESVTATADVRTRSAALVKPAAGQ